MTNYCLIMVAILYLYKINQGLTDLFSNPFNYSSDQRWITSGYLNKKSIKRSRSNVQIWWWLSKNIFHKPHTTNIYKLLLHPHSGTLTLWRNIELFTNPCFGAINLNDLFFLWKSKRNLQWKGGKSGYKDVAVETFMYCSSESLYIFTGRERCMLTFTIN